MIKMLKNDVENNFTEITESSRRNFRNDLLLKDLIENALSTAYYPFHIRKHTKTSIVFIRISRIAYIAD